MKTLELIGYNREVVSKAETKKIRLSGHVPCVLYGLEGKNIHFYTPLILFRDLVYTTEVKFINMDIEGTEYSCILQDVQFHPVSENIIHADFFALAPNRNIKMNIPVRFTGTSPGVIKGGTLSQKLPTIKVEALPNDMPEVIDISIESLDLGQSIKISKIKTEKYTILNNPQVSIVTVLIPRSLRSADEETTEETAA